MSAINDLIEQIPNPELRFKIRQEVDRMSKQKKFGLVFEEHLPECTPLYDHPVKKGSIVARKAGKVSDNFVVKNIADGKAECEGVENHETETIDVAELVCVARFGEPIYPYLKPIDSICNAPDSDLWHTLIEADNYHALQLLEYLYAGKVDCIYIDPPYNSGARDWKYNNDYVDTNDSYRHSKWLSMMQKRLLIAKRLLNPKDSVLIVTIDEKEYVHLGGLLEDIFPEANMQMISSVINPSGVSRNNEFFRTDEYIYILRFGTCTPSKVLLPDEWVTAKTTGKDKLRWRRIRRQGSHDLRSDAANQFYPIYISQDGTHYVGCGRSLELTESRDSVEVPDDVMVVWPLKPDGTEGCWQISQDTLKELYEKGYIKVTHTNKWGYTPQYLAQGERKKVEDGQFPVVGYDEYGTIITEDSVGKAAFVPGTQWRISSHNAREQGSKLLRKIFGEKRFDFPKSLYAETDVIRFFTAEKKDALILDFFAGSGTTLHAVNLLNAEDGGKRRCIMVTNNEVSEAEAESLKAQGYQPGDEEWERMGIARYVNWPRTKCSISGKDVHGKLIPGDYFTNNVLEEELERSFIQIPFIDVLGALSLSLKKQLIKVIGTKENGLKGKGIKRETEFVIGKTATILFNPAVYEEWISELDGLDEISTVYIVTPDNTTFTAITNSVKDALAPISERKYLTLKRSDGFKTNAVFFKLGFLNKNSVALGRQFKELVPLLWMKSGAIGPCPSVDETIPDMLILPKNHFAVLIDEQQWPSFEELLAENDEIDTVFIITDSESGYQEMISHLNVSNTFQLYRDYLDNFRINKRR